MFKLFIYLSFQIISFTQLLSQTIPQPPIEWGEINIDELRMTSYPLDVDAEAIFLCDYGESRLDDDFKIQFTRHLRIKIYNKNGFDWGTFTIYLYTKDNTEFIDDLEAVTYNLNSEGDIIEKELDEDDIFEEEVSENYDKITFTMPGLEPGCIVEVKYTILIDNIYRIKDWEFQHEIPIRWSEYRTLFPSNLAYAGVSMGYENFVIKETTQMKVFHFGKTQAIIGSGNPNCNLTRWAVENAPAVKDAPYVSNLEDYKNRVELQLSGYAFPRNKKTDILGSWEKVVEELIDSKSFYEKIDDDSDVEELEKKITYGLINKKDKMLAIYNWVKNSIVWDKYERVFSELDPDEVIELKKGNSSEITFLLLSLLKSAGINGYPVILSTRSNGEIQTLYPIVNQFNYVLANVEIDSETYFLDATDPLRAYDLLPSDVIGVRGLVINPNNKKTEWITLSSNKHNITNTQIYVKLDETGTINGSFKEDFSDYRSLNYRNELQNESELEFIKEFYDTEENNYIIDSILIPTKDSIELPLRIETYFSAPEYAQINDDYLYINPLMIHRRESNPFKLKQRNFPVDYGYKRSYNSVISLYIPTNYEVDEEFKNKELRLDNDLKFKRIISVEDNFIQLLYRLDIKTTLISPNKYQKLREFYSQMIDLQSEQLVLRKKTNISQNN
ncbi:MAG: DUF3857 domain-containing protein [Ignavibacteriales bacterium]|nr:DUF3857 domain-containing protein [Ignavibacteriales bacterium]